MSRTSLAASRSSRVPVVVPLGLACGAVALQIAYPLTPQGRPRDLLTIATVVVFFGASTAHALASRGPRFAGMLVAVTGGGGFAVEALGVATGWPFGAYRYVDTLGPALLGVPVVIPLAWTMMGYPAYTVARRIMRAPVAGTALSGLRRRRWLEVVLAGWALAAWDLFLDPQMVAAGHWAWESAGPAVLGIPLSNFAGWFLVATLMMAGLRSADARLAGAIRHAGAAPQEAAPNDPAPDDRVPQALYLWVYASSVMAHLVFLGLPGSALLGGLGMGVVVLLFALAVRR